jgi:hypothetical protein
MNLIAKNNIIVTLLLTMVIFSIAAIAIYCLEQKINYYDLENFELRLCKVVNIFNISLISHPIAFLLTLLYTFLLWRHSNTNKYLYRRPIVLIVIQSFKKKDRLPISLIYAIISYEILKIIEKALNGSAKTYDQLIKEPTGLIELLMRVIEMFISAMRYYPIIVVFSAKSVFFYTTGTLYMLIDIANNVYHESKCNEYEEIYLFNELISMDSEIKLVQMLYKILKVMPHLFGLSLVTATLIQKSFEYFLSLIRSNAYHLSDIFFNEDLTFYSHSDINYTRLLLNRNKNLIKKQNKQMSQLIKLKEVKKNLFKSYIYEWRPDFKFSSRTINSYVVSCLTLYYFFIKWIYYGILYFKHSTYSSKEYINNIALLANLAGVEFEPADILGKQLHLYVFLFSSCLSFLICLLHTFFGMRSVQKNLIKMYRGDYTDVTRKEEREINGNHLYATGNSHYSG